MYIQAGKNNKYPDSIEVWRKGEIVPEWLSDVCKVSFIDGEGNITIGTRSTSTGGYELLSATGEKVLLKVSSVEDYVCRGNNGEILVLTPVQLDLLYKLKK